VREWYPNFRPDYQDELALPTFARRLKALCESRWLRGPARAYEWMCRAAYRAHLQRQAPRWSSPEQVRLEADCLKLHTHSHRRRVREAFEAALDREAHDRSGAAM
jgi:hypothetical protein